MDINSEKWLETVKNGCSKFNIEVSENELSLFQKYSIELLKWNRKTNLTSIKDPFEVAVKHIIDSTYPVKIIDGAKRIIDLGSGGGFPVIPLKILKPEISFVMVESSRKKVTFLKHIIRTLKLKNIEAVNIRCEELSKDDDYKMTFDFAISRAFTELGRFINLAKPFVSEKGKIIAMKGREIDEEIVEMKKLNLQYSIDKYELPYISDKRSQIIISLG
ncbi:MAG: 16S rRNA (guanine(527)-N(7))-methyltransferase RsmG [Desulfobacterales bacterium]|nr:16S rRNA (guanine(527)-N(7))-methyltransferase RsmG [Desulfobacterales bacterium]